MTARGGHRAGSRQRPSPPRPVDFCPAMTTESENPRPASRRVLAGGRSPSSASAPWRWSSRSSTCSARTPSSSSPATTRRARSSCSPSLVAVVPPLIGIAAVTRRHPHRPASRHDRLRRRRSACSGRRSCWPCCARPALDPVVLVVLILALGGGAAGLSGWCCARPAGGCSSPTSPRPTCVFLGLFLFASPAADLVSGAGGADVGHVVDARAAGSGRRDRARRVPGGDDHAEPTARSTASATRGSPSWRR